MTETKSDTITVSREIYESVKAYDEKTAYNQGFADAQEKALKGHMLGIFSILSGKSMCDSSHELLSAVRRNPIFKDEMKRISELGQSR